jgi:hypothetical protein
MTILQLQKLHDHDRTISQSQNLHDGTIPQLQNLHSHDMTISQSQRSTKIITWGLFPKSISGH